jgi:hypothetical protein
VILTSENCNVINMHEIPSKLSMISKGVAL